MQEQDGRDRQVIDLSKNPQCVLYVTGGELVLYDGRELVVTVNTGFKSEDREPGMWWLEHVYFTPIESPKGVEHLRSPRILDSPDMGGWAMLTRCDWLDSLRHGRCYIGKM